jgi:protein-S-isoprenylcysteine O-methyltransferase Ste14
MKLMYKKLIAVILAWTLIYCILAFVQEELNPMEWIQLIKIVLVFGGAILSWVFVIALDEANKLPDPKSRKRTREGIQNEINNLK